MQKIIFVLLCGAFIGSCGSWIGGKIQLMGNEDRSLIDSSRQTLIANLMGVDRGADCHTYGYDGMGFERERCDWFASQIEPKGKHGLGWIYKRDRPIATFLVLRISPFLEWSILLFLIVCFLPPEIQKLIDDDLKRTEEEKFARIKGLDLAKSGEPEEKAEKKEWWQE